jgi:nucleoid-associated protein YgaU
MTSDAKVGLLLGLVFIFLIAFIINGLPDFGESGNNNELTTEMVGSGGLGARERKVRREVIERIEPVERQSFTVQSPPSSEKEVRFTMELPKSISAVKEKVEVETARIAESLPVVEKKEGSRLERIAAASPKFYVVGEGDNLAIISKMVYGDEEGNRKVNVDGIFEANRGVLKSPDELYVGQKLIIPPLPGSAPVQVKSKVEKVFSGAEFVKVESIGKRHLPAKVRGVKRSEQYVVQDGDSLWRIAAEELGDGNRYSEIAKLNADILENEDSLFVGMRLKLPVR